jgi:hypothetical protein
MGKKKKKKKKKKEDQEEKKIRRKKINVNIESKILIGRYLLGCLDFYCRIILIVHVTGTVLRMWS